MPQPVTSSSTKNGWLVDSSEPQTYIQRALDITRNANTLGLAREFTRASVAHLGWDEIAAQVEDIFQRTIEMA